MAITPATARKLSERPDKFELDPGHTLARGLQFAGLGQNFNQLLYRDASNNRGDLNNYNTPQMLRRFGRPMLRYTDTLLQYTYNPSNDITLLEGSASIWFAQHKARNNAVFLGHGYEAAQQFGIRTSSGSSTRFWINGNGVWKNGPTTVYDEFNHFCLVWDAVNWALYYNGDPFFSEPHGVTLTPRTDYVLLATQRPGNASETRYVSYTAGDAMIWDRPLTSDEVAILADPGNVSLGGLIQERKSAYWVIPSQVGPTPTDIEGVGTAIASGTAQAQAAGQLTGTGTALASGTAAATALTSLDAKGTALASGTAQAAAPTLSGSGTALASGIASGSLTGTLEGSGMALASGTAIQAGSYVLEGTALASGQADGVLLGRLYTFVLCGIELQSGLGNLLLSSGGKLALSQQTDPCGPTPIAIASGTGQLVDATLLDAISDVCLSFEQTTEVTVTCQLATQVQLTITGGRCQDANV